MKGGTFFWGKKKRGFENSHSMGQCDAVTSKSPPRLPEGLGFGKGGGGGGGGRIAPDTLKENSRGFSGRKLESHARPKYTVAERFRRGDVRGGRSL